MARWNEHGKSRRKPAKVKSPRGTVEVKCMHCEAAWKRRKPTHALLACNRCK